MNELDVIKLLNDFTKRRYMIYLYIKGNYCNISDVSRNFNISYKEAYREVSILSSMNYIKKKRLKTKNQPCILILNDKRELGFRKVRDEIIFLLSNPQTATDLKEKMPHISSTGTIAYHLKNLEKEGMIVREVKEHVRGKPVYYYLTKNENVSEGVLK